MTVSSTVLQSPCVELHSFLRQSSLKKENPSVPVSSLADGSRGSNAHAPDDRRRKEGVSPPAKGLIHHGRRLSKLTGHRQGGSHLPPEPDAEGMHEGYRGEAADYTTHPGLVGISVFQQRKPSAPDTSVSPTVNQAPQWWLSVGKRARQYPGEAN